MVELVELLKAKSKGRSKNFYNIMPIDNIPSVIEHGILSFNKTRSLPHQSIALSDVQNRREKVQIPNGNSLHSYANLYFTYHNPMLYRRQDEAENLVILAISQEVINIDGCIISDQNAATDLVKFYTPDDALIKLNFDLIFAQDWRDTNPYTFSYKKATKCAEILIPDCVPYEYIIGAYVLNKDNELKLRQMGFDKKIAISSKVFYR